MPNILQEHKHMFAFDIRWNSHSKKILSVWYKTKFGSQNLATKFGVFLVTYVMF